MAIICVPVCVPTIEEMRRMIRQRTAGADIIELRLDCLEELSGVASLLSDLKLTDRPFILTLRAPEQGGQGSFAYQTRKQFWSTLKEVPVDCRFDLEYDLFQDFSLPESVAKDFIHPCRVICSHHDFNGVPADLDRLYKELSATSAGTIKIAVEAHDVTDCLPILGLLARARREGRNLIAIAMGAAGIMTRILGPARGSFLTYGSIEDELATAPGQVTADELRHLYRVDKIDQETEILGIIGNPIGHSFSPRIHNAAFAAGEMNAVFIPFEVHDGVQFMRRMVNPATREIDWNLRGLSVTAPHKSTVMQCLDKIDSAAQEIGAVNTIVVRAGQMLGYNTDAAGFLLPLRRRFGSLKRVRCAVLGAGGAARACLWALQNERAECVLFARHPEKARSLAEEFKLECRPLDDAGFGGFDIVVNATPLGTRGAQEQETAAGVSQLHGVRLAYDLVYNPLQTRFLNAAREAGCEALDGMEMLLAQAIEQFRLWMGRDPDAEVMRASALGKLRG